MNSYHKYFVSQHFGKSLVTVELGNSGGTVVLGLSCPAALKVKYTFGKERLAQFVQQADRLAEMAARIAIQQSHRLFGNKGLHADEAEVRELALDTAPWIGDLTDAPYGGATAGYEHGTPPPPHDAAGGGARPLPA